MEGTPATIIMKKWEGRFDRLGVRDVRLHIWTITSGLDSLSCHLLIKTIAL